MDSGLGGYFDTANLLRILDRGASFCIPESRIADLRGAVGIYQSHNSTAGETYVREKMTTGALASHFRRLSIDEAAQATCSPMKLLIKSNGVDWRIVYDMSSPLRTPDGRTLPSMNELMYHPGLPSVPVGTSTRELDLICTVGHLVGLERRNKIRMMIFDLKHAFYGVLLAASEQLLAAFKLGTETWAHKGLPMGSILSPSIYGRFSMMNWRYQELVMGLLISWFVDDSLLINVDGDSCAQDAADLRAMLEWAGWKLNEKCSTQPMARVQSLGLIFDVETWTVEVRKGILENLEANMLKLLGRDTLTVQHRHKAKWISKLIEEIIGGLNFCQAVVRTLAAPMHFYLAQLHQVTHWVKGPTFQMPPEHTLVINFTREIMRRYGKAPMISRTLELQLAHGHSLRSDASGDGYGAWGRDRRGHIFYFFGDWKDMSQIPPATHSNDLELAAALMMMDHLIPQVLPGAAFVDLVTDNTNVARWISTLSCKVKDSGSDKERAQWLHAAGLHQAERNIYIHCRQEDRESNTWADALSKPELRERLF